MRRRVWVAGPPPPPTRGRSLFRQPVQPSRRSALTTCWAPAAATRASYNYTRAQLYQTNVYYTFVLTVGNFLGYFSTASFTVYKSSLALPSLQPQGATSQTYHTTDAFALNVNATVSSCLSVAGTGQMAYSWSVSPAVNINGSNPLLQVPAYLLTPGVYTFTVTGYVVVQPSLVASASFIVAVLPSPVAVVIAGGAQQTFSDAAIIALNATVYDPDTLTQQSSQWSYTWSCLTTGGQPCLDNLLGSTLAMSFTMSQVVAPKTLASGSYVFTVTATNSAYSVARVATASVTVSVVSYPLPTVIISTILPVITTSSLLYYTALASDATNGLFSYQWSQVSGPTLDLAAVALSTTSRRFVLNNAGASVFTSGATYTFQVLATNLNTSESNVARTSASVSGPPYGGSLTVFPLTGQAAGTNFTFTADGWQSATGSPLSYLFAQVSSITGFQYPLNMPVSTSPRLVCNLPLQNDPTSTVMVLVRDISDVSSFTTYSISLTLTPPVDDFFAPASFNALGTFAQTGNAGLALATFNTLLDTVAITRLNSSQVTNSSATQSEVGVGQVLAIYSAVASTVTALPLSALLTATKILSVVGPLSPQILSQSVSSILPQASAAVDVSYPTVNVTLTSTGHSIEPPSLNAGIQAIQPQNDVQSIMAYALELTTYTLYQQNGSNRATSPSRRLLAADDDGVDLQLLMTYLLSNISAQCDRLSIRGGLLVAGQTMSVSASGLVVLVGRAAVTDATAFSFSSGDNSSVSFPAQSMAGGVAVDGWTVLGLTDSAVLDSRVYYMPTSLYFWTANTSAPLSSVLFFQRTTTAAVAFDAQPALTVTAVLSLPILATANCSLPTCMPLCAVWDDANALWTLGSTVLSSPVYVNAAGQQVVDCQVRSLTSASVAVFAVNGSYTSCAATSSCSSSSQSAAPVPSSSSGGVSASPTSASSASAPVYAAGSVRVRFLVDVDATANLSVLIPELRADIAHNLGGFFGLNDTAFLPYVFIVSFNGNDITVTTPAMRRLLSTVEAPVVFVLLNTISALSTSSAPINVSAAVHNFVQAANHSLLSTPNSGLTIPAQNPTVSDANAPVGSSSGLGYVPSSDLSSSSLAVPLGLGLGLGLGLPLLALVLWWAYRQVVVARKRLQLPVSPASKGVMTPPEKEAAMAVQEEGATGV